MSILVIGSGGREHAIISTLSHEAKLYTTHPGISTATHINCCDTDIDALCTAIQTHNIALVIIGPEASLAQGSVDRFRDLGVAVVGPTQAAAQLETSKLFAKAFMKRHQIPTADYAVFETKSAAQAYLSTASYPIVIKADGLAAGKGVFVVHTQAAADAALETLFTEKRFGDTPVVIESFLSGTEASLMAFVDNNTIIPLPYAQDYKRAYDADAGPNTGGMGAISPPDSITPAIDAYIKERIVYPTHRAIQSEQLDYRGILYIGLMIHANGTASVIEYNVRYGDPEAQAVLPRLDTKKSSYLAIYNAIAANRLDTLDAIAWLPVCTAYVVLASGGYPDAYTTGHPIQIDTDDTQLFYAGVALKDKQLVTSGGRVMGVLGTGPSLDSAVKQAYARIPSIQFLGMRYRSDIGR